jgi:hypothetical protein
MDKPRFCFTYKLTLAVSSVLLINCDVSFGLQAEGISPEQMKHTTACAHAKTCPCPTEKIDDVDMKKCSGDNDCVNRLYNLQLLINECNSVVIACSSGSSERESARPTIGGSSEVWQQYLRDYPDSPYAEIARQRLQQLIGNTIVPNGHGSPDKRADKFRISGQVKWTNTVVRREWTRTTSGTDSLAYTVDGNRLTISDSDGTLVCGLNAPISQSVRAVGGGGAGTALCSFSHDGDTIRINYDGTSLNKYGGAPFHDHRRILISINESNCTMSAQVNSDGDTALMRGSVWNGHFSHYTTHASASGSCKTE